MRTLFVLCLLVSAASCGLTPQQQGGDILIIGDSVMAVFGVVQTLEGLVIQPKIIGDRVGLHPMTIIVALMIGTTLLGGILGGILAIPLTAALRVLMFRYVWKH